MDYYMTLNNLIIQHALDVENLDLMFDLATAYDAIGQTAAAITFYLKVADRTSNILKRYQCLLLIAACFSKQGGRDYTVKSIYEQAASILPQRQEAYYHLSKIYEHKKEYSLAYSYACIGLAQAEHENISLYPGSYALLFQKAVAAWWCGKAKETRAVLQELVNVHWSDMDDVHKAAVERNITRLGSGPESQAFKTYYKSQHSLLRKQFTGSELIERNYAQVYQDLFVLAALNGKNGGSFLEIGGAKPYLGNNTAILEQLYDWRGVSIEYDAALASEYSNARPKTKMLNTDALKIDYAKLLRENFAQDVDYLQLDIEPARNTFECLLSIPFDKHRFAVITYEHDYYVDVTRSYRDKSRRYLTSIGYKLVVSDVSPDGVSSFEDWWVHPDLVDVDTVSALLDVSPQTKDATKYMFPGYIK